MKFMMRCDTSLTFDAFDGQRCQFGLTEIALPAALEFGADALGFLGLGGAEAAGAGAAGAGLETGLATIGAGAGGAAAGAGGLADLIGTGAGLFGGAEGLLGTSIASGGASDLASLFGTGGTGFLDTIASFLANPGASGFNPGALSPSTFGDVASTGVGGSSGLPPGVANANASAPAASVFDTGAPGVPGVNGAGAPSTVPGGGGAAALQAPAGVTAPVDATSGIAGAAGPTSVGGSPLGAAPAPTSSIDQLLGKAGTGVLDSLTKNPLGVGLGAAGLGYNVLQGQKSTANQKALAGDAAAATTNSNEMVKSGEALQQYLTSGTLPPAYQQQVDQAIADAKTSAISNAAAQGQPTDPTKNTALAATLAKIDASRAAMQTQVATQLFSSGTSLVQSGAAAAGLSGQLYEALVQNDTTQAANTGKAIATLAAALNGKSQNTAGNVTISTG